MQRCIRMALALRVFAQGGSAYTDTVVMGGVESGSRQGSIKWLCGGALKAEWEPARESEGVRVLWEEESTVP